MTDPQQVQKAESALRSAISPRQDDFAHPDHLDLVAFAESTLAAADREIVQSHVESCAQCAEDVRDITELREQMTAQPPVPKVSNTWKYLVAGAVVAAAVLVVAVIWKDPNPAPEIKEAVAIPAPPASPREIALSTSEQAAVDAAIAAGRVEVPAQVRALQGSVGQLLGAEPVSTGLLPMSPAGTLVATATPQFSWQPIPGAVSYSVAVFDAAFRLVASSNPVKTSSWTPRAQLPTNVPLAWQITARMADGTDVLAPAPPRPEARFTVMDEAAAAAIAELRSRLSDQPIALGILLAKAGLVDDAAREFTRAAAQPELAEIAAKLRSSLKPAQ